MRHCLPYDRSSPLYKFGAPQTSTILVLEPPGRLVVSPLYFRNKKQTGLNKTNTTRHKLKMVDIRCLILLCLVTRYHSLPVEDSDVDLLIPDGLDQNGIDGNDNIDLSNLGSEAYGSPKDESGKIKFKSNAACCTIFSCHTKNLFLEEFVCK